MVELFKNFSIETVLVVITLSCLALKEIITFIDWSREKITKKMDKDTYFTDAVKDINDRIDTLSAEVSKVNENYQNYMQSENTKQEELTKAISVLVESDKDDIKAWITEKHHFFCYEKGFIDDYSLDTIEKRYKHYTDEGGNSFVEGLMEQLRALPRRDAQDNYNNKNL